MWSIKRHGPAVFVQLSDAIIADVRRGALRAGDRLPSTRTLAREQGVNRNTIVAAYDELIAQGWAIAHGAAGTCIASDIPDRFARRPSAATGLVTRPAFELPTHAPAFTPLTAARYSISAGVPDTRLAPTVALARAYRRALRRHDTLDYADPFGAPRLRAAIAELVRTSRGIPASSTNVMITRGSQMGIELAARLLVRPGRTVAVEQLGYAPAWRSFEQAGARLVPIPLDDAGLVVDALPRTAPACVYTTPHHQYPTTVVLAPARRLELLARARRDGFAVIEDDYDHEFHYEGRPIAPLAATDRGETVIYCGTLSKTLAPGLRLGFVVAAERVIEQLGALRASIDRQGDRVLETAVAELLEDDELQRHARKVRRLYHARRDALVAALERELGDVVSVRVPAGGITLWVRVAPEVALERWRSRALERGVAFSIGRDFDLTGRPHPFIRIGFARYAEVELVEAVRRMRLALP